MKRALLLALLPATLIGCATPPADPGTTTVASQDATCDKETKTGSMMPTVRCRTAAQREADAKSAENAKDFVRGTNQVMQPGK
jgi:hypothetical protein